MKNKLIRRGNSLLNKFVPLLLVLMILILLGNTIHSQTLPTGFNQVLVANGISNPTVFSFAPDGRIFVAKQNGELRIIKNNALLPTPFITLSVNSSGERGLLGIAFDPNFVNNNYIYLYYTLSIARVGQTALNNRISRFTANGDVVLAGSEVVVLDLDPLSGATNHNGGSMKFGADGKLYVGIGENANGALAQNLDTYHGKVLRINADGSVPSGNPFTSGSEQKRRIWSYGLRNPYTLAVQPTTGRIFVNDVGQNTWEEINDCTTGGFNYGWPSAEGNSTNPNFKNPLYAYNHGSSVGQGCAITGGAFFNPTTTNYPSIYIGNYFYFDFCGSWMDKLSLSGPSATRSNFGTGLAGSRVALETGPDGNLYFLSRSAGAIYNITYNAVSGPVITQQPQNQTVSQGNTATFSVTASGTAPLNYQWRKNSINIIGATSSSFNIISAFPSDAGTYSVVVTNASNSVFSNNATLNVTVPNQVPVANIISPSNGATYGGGQVFQFSGTASDPEQGNLGNTAYNWYVIFHHDNHIHPGPSVTSSGGTGSFTVPVSGETAVNVFYRLFLVATDNQGARDTAFTDILPRTSNITINSSPQGLQITLDSQPFTAPLTVSSVEGIERVIGTSSPQTIGAASYQFNSWSNGGTMNQTISTPVNDVVFTASFNSNSIITLTSVADAHVQSGVNSGNNFGTAPLLISKATNDDKWKREIYIKFDISSIINVGSARLRLFGSLLNNQNPSCAVQVFNVSDNTWSENTITWNNKPAANGSALGNATVSGTTDQNYEWDVTSAVQTAKTAGNQHISLKVVNTTVTTGSYTDFNSRQADANVPVLIVSPPSNTLVLNPVADSYVQAGGKSTTNFGAAASIIVKKTVEPSFKREGFIRFNISSLPTTSANVILRLYGSLLNNGTSGNIELHPVSNQTWNETSITFNNKPSASADIIASSLVSGTTDQNYDFNVTAYVNTAKESGATLVSFQIISTTEFGNNFIEFASKEAALNKPQLIFAPVALKLSGEDDENNEKEIVVENKIRIYPNPAVDYLNISLPGFAGQMNVLVYELNGRLVKNLTITGENIFYLPLSKLNSGMYIIRMDWIGGTQSERIVIH